VNGDNMDNIRCEASRIFRTKKREYLKNKINELETNSKNKNIRDLYRGINEFKKGYQPRTNMVKEENGDLLADSHSILNRWKNNFCQLLNIHGVKDVWQIEIHAAEPLVPEPSSSQVEIATEKLKKYKSPGIDQILAEPIQAGGKHYVLRSTNLLIVFGIRKNCQRNGRNLLLYLYLNFTCSFDDFVEIDIDVLLCGLISIDKLGDEYSEVKDTN
jgi:hypothetical protein